MPKFSLAIGFIIFPLALVFSAIRPRLFSLSFSDISQPFLMGSNNKGGK